MSTTKELLKRALEHAPTGGMQGPDDLVGWWASSCRPGDNSIIFVCNQCMGRVAARGMMPTFGTVPVWNDSPEVQNKERLVCDGCDETVTD